MDNSSLKQQLFSYTSLQPLLHTSASNVVFRLSICTTQNHSTGSILFYAFMYDCSEQLSTRNEIAGRILSTYVDRQIRRYAHVCFSNYIDPIKSEILMNSFISLQSDYCPPVWVFNYRATSTKLNCSFERTPRLLCKSHDLKAS